MPHIPTVRTIDPSIASLSTALSSLEDFALLFLRSFTAIGVMKVLAKAMIVPDALAIVIAVSEKLTSKR